MTLLPDLGNIYNFYPLNDRVASAGQPTAEEFTAVHQAGYQVIINLATTDSTQALLNERGIVAQLGLDYVHIPVIWNSPQRRDFEKFCQAMQAYDGRKIFVHCIANMRVSAFLYLYQRHLGLPNAAARQILDAIWQPNPTWQQFIDDILADFA
ncbi:MAG: protein tyrosine phosphatase family protein [Ardenticatenaceae bacterium]|nr:protein tyrosine phosphatase family protein [Ardenticatenaceae bacterium]